MNERTNMSATPLIHQLVRDGRARPRDGALLLELRRDLQKQRVRQSRGVLGSVLVGLAIFVLGAFGFKRSA